MNVHYIKIDTFGDISESGGSEMDDSGSEDEEEEGAEDTERMVPYSKIHL